MNVVLDFGAPLYRQLCCSDAVLIMLHCMRKGDTNRPTTKIKISNFLSTPKSCHGKVVLHSHHYFTIIYNFSDTVLGDMWRQLLSSTIYTGLASPVQSQGESGGRRLKNKNSNREQSERQNWQHRKEHAISNLTTIHQHLRERRPLVRRPVPPNAGQIWQSSVDRGRSSQEACTSPRS